MGPNGGAVSMDEYWNYVGTPLFFSVLGFGIFVLFQANSIQFSSGDEVRQAFAKIKAQQFGSRRPVIPPHVTPTKLGKQK